MDFDNLTNESLFNKLKKIDDDLANKITIHNRKRLVRALQVLSVHDNMHKVNPPIYEPLYICCNLPREILYQKINERTDLMMKQG
ncbi:hypothetical protein FACS1894218_6290 [Bacilli bacterium]|nr:hypothetical protein FACS1894218_6290 [Bacilli bacterium]